MKVYVVKKGYRPGIYHSWPEAEEQVKGFPGAEYKSFSNIMEALDYQQMNPEDALKALQGAEDKLQAAIAKGIFAKLNTSENRNALQKLWDAIVNFFTSLFSSLSK